jgi:hypothetical protein
MWYMHACVMDSQVLPILSVVTGIMLGKKKVRFINQVCKVSWVVLNPTRRMPYLLRPLPEVLKALTEEAVVMVELPERAAAVFEPPPEDITGRKVAFSADVELWIDNARLLA